MYTRIVTFRLSDLPADTYEALADEVADAFNSWPGLHSKIWLADRDSATYGGVYVFEDRHAAEASRHTDIFTAMTTNPHFTELNIAEYNVLTAPTARTGGALAVSTPDELPAQHSR